MDHQDLFLVDFKLKGTQGNQKVLVLIDGDQGVTVDACGKLSRSIGGKMEEEDILSGKYILEVSSPGLDFPLQVNRQYPKNIGRSLSIKRASGQVTEGVLVEVMEEGIRLDEGQETLALKWEEIIETRIKISFK